jgi:hypothetical protein
MGVSGQAGIIAMFTFVNITVAMLTMANDQVNIPPHNPALQAI